MIISLQPWKEKKRRSLPARAVTVSLSLSVAGSDYLHPEHHLYDILFYQLHVWPPSKGLQAVTGREEEKTDNIKKSLKLFYMRP